MIIPMKKLTIFTLKCYENQALEELRELGVVHLDTLVIKNNDSRDRLDLINEQAMLDRLIGELAELNVEAKSNGKFDGKTLTTKAIELLEQKDKLAQEIEVAKKSISDMSAWGEFDFADLEKFQKHGLRLYLCSVASDDKFKEFEANESYHCIELNRTKSAINFVIASAQKLEMSKLPLANINPKESLSELKSKLKVLEKKAIKLQDEICEVAGNVDVLLNYKQELNSEVEFLTARDAMSLDGDISYINGYLPTNEFANFENVAKTSSWGFFAEDAERTNEVPTLIKMPKWAKIIKPLFDFLAINPGYDELDVSGAFTIFFSIFFGILIGDAGYGAVFFIASLIAYIKFKKDVKVGQICKLVMFLSFFAIIWGALTNNYFGTAPFKGLPQLTDELTKDKNTQIICFSLGVMQLSLGHFWKMIIDGRWRNVCAQLGWVLVMVGNFILINKMLVSPGAYPPFMLYCYGIGIALIGICEVEWLDAASVFGFPFGIVNSFVDMLSYIRLFAVGMAGYYLAASFNMMASGVMHSGTIGVIGGIFILLIGHSLNIGLSILSVLVHGVRLNTLEFSSHVGLQWTGHAYKPFKNLVK